PSMSSCSELVAVTVPRRTVTSTWRSGTHGGTTTVSWVEVPDRTVARMPLSRTSLSGAYVLKPRPAITIVSPALTGLGETDCSSGRRTTHAWKTAGGRFPPRTRASTWYVPGSSPG